MISKTLFCLLENLTNDERIRLAEYIKSPFFNKDENVVRLYSFLQKKMRQKQVQNFDKRAVAKYVFPKREAATAERKVITLFKKIEQLTLDFLVVLKREENPNENIIFLLNALNDRHIEVVWKKNWDKYVKNRKKVSGNVDEFRHNYLLAKNWHEFAIFDSKLKLKPNLEEVVSSFETYYITQMLQYICAALNNKQKYNKQIDLPMVPLILKTVVERKLDKKEPLINCYKAIILLLQTQDQQYFDDLLEILTHETLGLKQEELNGIYTIVINYCIGQYRQGKDIFREYVFILYTQMLKNECLIINHYLGYMHFKNILTLALTLNKTAWAKDFVAKYESRLNPTLREDMKHYSEGLIAFYEEKYEEAQILFLYINEFNFVFHLNKEIYLLKVFYFCKNSLIESKLETLRSYLRQNKKLTLKARKEHSAFYKMMKQLYRIREQYDFFKRNPKKLEKIKKQVEKLLQSLESEQAVTQKLWLKNQASDLLKMIES
ncbi:MAG: hypothetical protein ACPG5B_03105 [Chitinophagales bacterium]